MAFHLDFPSGHGAGAITASIGAGMACSLITRVGDEPGTTVANMLTPMQAYTVTGREIASRNIMKLSNGLTVNGARNEKDGVRRKNMAATETIMAEITEGTTERITEETTTDIKTRSICVL